eukprot:462196-Prorocentrum_minimum.AAC.1
MSIITCGPMSCGSFSASADASSSAESLCAAGKFSARHARHTAATLPPPPPPSDVPPSPPLAWTSA